jgi:hypothetical protein
MTISGGFADNSAGGGFPDAFAGDQGVMLLNALKSFNFVTGVSGWEIQRNGNAEFNNLTIRGTFFGSNFVISTLGAFFYSGAPALGNLIASIAPADGADDGEGNPFFAGFVSYDNVNNIYMQLFDSNLTTGFKADSAGIQPTLGFSEAFKSLVLESGQTLGVTFNQSSLELRARDGALGFTGGVALFGGSVEIDDNEAAGNLLIINNNHANPTDSNLKIINASGNDNSIGIQVSGRAFNSLKFTDQGMLAGPGTATQDTLFLRAAVGQWISDDILANISGSAEVWHSLGTLAGATVNKGRYRMMPTGNVRVEIDVTFGVSTAAPITWSNTLPAAYRAPGSVDVRVPMTQTNGAGGIGRTFIGSAGGGSPGSVQLAALANVIGTYSCYEEYSLL